MNVKGKEEQVILRLISLQTIQQREGLTAGNERENGNEKNEMWQRIEINVNGGGWEVTSHFLSP